MGTATHPGVEFQACLTNDRPKETADELKERSWAHFAAYASLDNGIHNYTTHLVSELSFTRASVL